MVITTLGAKLGLCRSKIYSKLFLRINLFKMNLICFPNYDLNIQIREAINSEKRFFVKSLHKMVTIAIHR